MGSMSFTIRDAASMARGIEGIKNLVAKGLQAGPVVITLGREKRTESQNKKMWPLLQDVSEQVKWYDQWLMPEDWKNMFTAALRKSKVVPGIDGGVVVLGISTSTMRKKEFSNLIELIYAFGAEHEVKWSEKAIDIYETYREAA